MINTTVLFYNVGLNEKNLAYNWNTLSRILAAGIITDNGQAYELHLTALPFGQVFNISQEVYDKVKTATYIVIENTDPEKPNATPDARACFINNFLQLANGNWSVSYTIDDWSSFYLNPDSPYNIYIDGFTERANVPLISLANSVTILNTRQTPLTGKTNENLIKTFFNSDLAYLGVDRDLPDGWKCRLYSIDIPKSNGISHNGANGHGYICDYSVKDNTIRLIDRQNSNLYITLFDESGIDVPIFYRAASSIFQATDGEIDINDGAQTFTRSKSFTINDPDDSTILKIMTFNFLPTIDGKDNNNNIVPYWSVSQNYTNIFQIKTLAEIYPSKAHYQNANLKVLFIDYDYSRLLDFADIYVREELSTVYFKAPSISILSTLFAFDLPNAIKAEKSPITKLTNLNQYYLNSLYSYIDESRQIKIKFLTAELIIPSARLFANSKIYVCISGDLETLIIKYYDGGEVPLTYRSNELAGTGQNTGYFDLVHVRDFKAYKNAKITGAAAVAASAVGSITALGTSIASGNVAGVIGALSGGIGGTVAGVQKLQGLTPAQVSPASGDFTLTQIISDNLDINKLLIEISQPAPENFISFIKDLEENGAAVAMAFDEYIDKCQMQAFNAVKMATMDVTGAPQQICRRIEEMFLSGVTLWTATDVGNKKVINYPLVTVPA